MGKWDDRSKIKIKFFTKKITVKNQTLALLALTLFQEALLTNKKYLLRSDIMFRRANPPPLNPNEEKALTLVAEAERLEDACEFQEAVKLYSRAYKLWPELENRKLSGGS